MANFAVLNGNVVINVVVADSKENAELATSMICVEYDEKLPAGIGMIYDGTGFIARQPFESWKLNSKTYKWEAPIKKPTDGKIYDWDETAGQWVVVE